MRGKFLDSLRIFVKGGAGGMGYPKYGGIGGAGGNVYVVGKEGKTLLDVVKQNIAKRVSAQSGEHSHKNKILGKKGEDAIIEAPTGISLYTESGLKLGEIDKEGSQVLAAKGGLGGNPENGYCGMKGESHTVILDLKLIADVGLVGFPNAGKSTLLSAVSRAKPKIASYPFTTISPNIGQIEYSDLRQISVADLPGLIEGAHANFGLGHSFLKHVERTKLLLLVVDVGGFQLGPKYSSRSCLETIILLNKELELYREDLVERPAILIVNKMDKKGSRDIFAEVEVAVNNLEAVFKEVPEHIRPNRALNFERVLSLAAKHKNIAEIDNLKKQIRDVLDITVAETTDDNSFIESLNKKLKVVGPLAI